LWVSAEVQREKGAAIQHDVGEGVRKGGSAEQVVCSREHRGGINFVLNMERRVETRGLFVPKAPFSRKKRAGGGEKKSAV